MTTASPTKDRPVAAWMGVLDQLERAVGLRLARTEDPAAPGPEPAGPAVTPLQATDERLTQMQARLDRAEQDAREADEVLRAEAEAFQHWTETAAAVRRRLADCAAGAEEGKRGRGEEGRRQDPGGYTPGHTG